MALTADQITDFQNYLGIDNSQVVFTDAALDRLYTLAEEEFNTAVYLAWLQIEGSSTAYIDYKVALTEEKRSQVFAHIGKMVERWEKRSQASSNSQGLAILGLSQIPPRWKEVPSETLDERRRRERSYR